MNKVILMGRLTRDPEMRYSQSASPVAVAKYGLAVRRQYSKQGEPDVDFFNIVAFGKAGEFAEKYFRKGQMVSVVGRLQVNNYEDQQKVKRTSVDVVIEEQHFAEGKAGAETKSEQADRKFRENTTKPPNQFQASVEDDDDDCMPF